MEIFVKESEREALSLVGTVTRVHKGDSPVRLWECGFGESSVAAAMAEQCRCLSSFHRSLTFSVHRVGRHVDERFVFVASETAEGEEVVVLTTTADLERRRLVGGVVFRILPLHLRL
jgi:hypothetical protein